MVYVDLALTTTTYEFVFVESEVFDPSFVLSISLYQFAFPIPDLNY